MANETTPLQGSDAASKEQSTAKNVLEVTSSPRTYALIGGVGMILEGLVAVLTHIFKAQFRHTIIDVYILIFGSLIITVESGNFSPYTTPLKEFYAKHVSVVHNMTKRGLVYIVGGSLELTRDGSLPGGNIATFLGLWVVIVGAAYAVIGHVMARKIDEARSEITYAPIQSMSLQTGELNPEEFRQVLKDIDLNINWWQAEMLFIALDKNFDRLISLNDVKEFFEQ